jgi:hypothetical protein
MPSVPVPLDSPVDPAASRALFFIVSALSVVSHVEQFLALAVGALVE